MLDRIRSQLRHVDLQPLCDFVKLMSVMPTDDQDVGSAGCLPGRGGPPVLPH